MAWRGLAEVAFTQSNTMERGESDYIDNAPCKGLSTNIWLYHLNKTLLHIRIDSHTAVLSLSVGFFRAFDVPRIRQERCQEQRWLCLEQTALYSVGEAEADAALLPWKWQEMTCLFEISTPPLFAVVQRHHEVRQGEEDTGSSPRLRFWAPGLPLAGYSRGIRADEPFGGVICAC